MMTSKRGKHALSVLRVLSVLVMGLTMAALYVYISVGAYKAISARAFTKLIPFALLAVVYVGMGWGVGKLTVGFKKIMVATLVVTAIWVLAYAALPKLFRYLVKFFPVKKKSRLSRLVTPTRIACFVLLVAEVLLYLASRSGAVKKLSCLIPVGLLVIYFAVYCCAACNVPNFLKSIKASEFISWWSGKAAILELVMLAIVAVYTVIYCMKQSRGAKADRFADSDIMLLQNFDRYRITGYYLLKAKLQGVLLFAVQETEDGNRIHTVKAVDMPAERWATYCENEPQVAQILSYLDGKEDATDIHTLVRELRMRPSFQEEGGRRVEKTLQHISGVSAMATVLCGLPVWLVGFLKFMMCIYLKTTVQDLSFHVAVGTPVFFAVLSFFAMVMAHTIWELTFKRPLVKFKSIDFADVQQLFREADAAQLPLAEEKCTRLLRAYALFCGTAEGNQYWQAKAVEDKKESDTNMLMSEIQQIAKETCAENDGESLQ